MTEPASFTCPQCRMVSYNPNDVEQGYCGNCHEFTRLTGDMIEVRPGLFMPDWLLWVLQQAGDGGFTAEQAAEWLHEVGFEFDPVKHALGKQAIAAIRLGDRVGEATEFRPGIRGSVAHDPGEDRE